MLAKIIILQDRILKWDINSAEISKPRTIYRYQYLSILKWSMDRPSPLQVIVKSFKKPIFLALEMTSFSYCKWLSLGTLEGIAFGGGEGML